MSGGIDPDEVARAAREAAQKAADQEAEIAEALRRELET